MRERVVRSAACDKSRNRQQSLAASPQAPAAAAGARHSASSRVARPSPAMASPASSSSDKTGKMLLVGAGPGDPELLTLKAYRAIQEADLVLTDRLVPAEILDLAKCEVRVARKRCGKADLAQAELDAWGLDALRQGKRVVRLKNGDPFMFGRGGEEAVIYAEAGFDVEVIPGISSSLSAPMSAGIPATMRDIADQVLVCTGHGKQDRYPHLPEYCDHRTTVFLMAIGRIEGLTAALQNEKGYPSDLPAAIIHSATMADALTVRSTLGEIAAEVRRRGVEPPGTLVLGNVVNALTYLKHYRAASASNEVVTPVSKYQISYKPLEELPEVDMGAHIVLNAGRKRGGAQSSLLLSLPPPSVVNALLIALLACCAVYSAVTSLAVITPA